MLVKDHFSGIVVWTASATVLQWLSNIDDKQLVLVAKKYLNYWVRHQWINGITYMV